MRVEKNKNKQKNIVKFDLFIFPNNFNDQCYI